MSIKSVKIIKITIHENSFECFHNENLATYKNYYIKIISKNSNLERRY